MEDFIYSNIKKPELYIGTETIKLIIEDLKNQILKNRQSFMELQKVDSKHSHQIVNIDTIIDILNTYKWQESNENSNKEIILASYYGNPYITINLLIQSLYCKKAIILAIEDEMLGTNKLLVTLFNNILEKHKISPIVKLFNMVSGKEIISVQKELKEIICIGNSQAYYELKNIGIKKIKYIPFRNMVIFSEDDKYLELQHKLYEYAITNGIDTEVYEDMSILDFIKCIRMDETLERVVVFTENSDSIKILKENLKNIKLYINKNPFNDENFVLRLIKK